MSTSSISSAQRISHKHQSRGLVRDALEKQFARGRKLPSACVRGPECMTVIVHDYFIYFDYIDYIREGSSTK